MTSSPIILTVSDLRRIAPEIPGGKANLYLPYLIQAAGEFEINTPVRLAAFLAQITHESGEFKYLQEIWGPTDAQKRYEPPNKKAKELGNTQPRDGKRYKGRGVIQLTGRANYRRYGRMLGLDLENNPELAAQPEVAFRIAGAFWKTHGLNELADVGDFKEITGRINGGLNGYDKRLEYWAIAKQVLKGAHL